MGKYYCILVRIWLKCGLLQNLLEGLWWWQQCIFRKTLQFLPSFKLVDSVSSTYTTTKIFPNEYRLLYPSHIACPKENPHNLTKYKSEETLKTPISQLLSDWEILGTNRLIFKTRVLKLESLPWIGENWGVQLEQHLKITIFGLFVNWGKLGSIA